MTSLDDQHAAVLDLVATLTGPISVHGDTELAVQLRRTLPPVSDGSTAPATVVETTGTVVGIVAALEAVDDLGTVVSASIDPEVTIDLDLYADFHVRGITLRSVRPPHLSRGDDVGS